MMGTLAAALAGTGISTDKDHYRAEVKGDIEDVDGVLKITSIHVIYHLKTETAKKQEAQNALRDYLPKCPAAQSVIGCIQIDHEMLFE